MEDFPFSIDSERGLWRAQGLIEAYDFAIDRAAAARDYLQSVEDFSDE